MVAELLYILVKEVLNFNLSGVTSKSVKIKYVKHDNFENVKITHFWVPWFFFIHFNHFIFSKI